MKSQTFNALADAGNGSEAVPTLVRARVASVSLAASGGLTLNFPGIDALPLSQVREIS